MLIGFAGALLALVLLGQPARAATLDVAPAGGSYAVGARITVSVLVTSVEQAANAVSAAISFPKDKLEMVSVSKANSVVNLWVQEPSFSNEAGTVSFEGIVLNPGFRGTSGRVVDITLRVKAAGPATLSFASASVLANDGKGTNILSGLGSASFSLGVRATPESSTPAERSGTPAAPEITSSPHPDPGKWYPTSTAKFSWRTDKEIAAVRLLASRNPKDVPTVVISPPVHEREVQDLEDGVWYFHLQFRNGEGWGGIAHYRFQIDTTAPARFTMRELERRDLTEPTARLRMEASDGASGISHYEIQIDSETARVWKDDGSHLFETPPLGPGSHLVIAWAVDQAGNSVPASINVVVQPLATPVLSEYPRTLGPDDVLVVRGKTSYAAGQIAVWLAREGEEAKSYRVNADNNGEFIFVAEKKLGEGAWTLWAEASDARGARSVPTEKVVIAVEKPAVWRIGERAVMYLTVTVTVVALVPLLLALLAYSWYRFMRFRRKLRQEVHRAEGVIDKAFDALRKDVRAHVLSLEKAKRRRSLTEEEERMLRQLAQDLERAE